MRKIEIFVLLVCLALSPACAQGVDTSAAEAAPTVTVHEIPGEWHTPAGASMSLKADGTFVLDDFPRREIRDLEPGDNPGVVYAEGTWTMDSLPGSGKLMVELDIDPSRFFTSGYVLPLRIDESKGRVSLYFWDESGVNPEYVLTK